MIPTTRDEDEAPVSDDELKDLCAALLTFHYDGVWDADLIASARSLWDRVRAAYPTIIDKHKSYSRNIRLKLRKLGSQRRALLLPANRESLKRVINLARAAVNFINVIVRLLIDADCADYFLIETMDIIKRRLEEVR